MIASIYSQLVVPYRDQVLQAEGILSLSWQGFFRSLVSEISSLSRKFESKTSDNFPISTLGFGSGEYAQMSGNSVVLDPGDWILNGQILAGWGSSAPTWTRILGMWSSENGANSGTQPPALPAVAGFGIFSSTLSSSIQQSFNLPSVRVSVKSKTEIFLVPSADFSSAGDAYFKAYIYAERVSSFLNRGVS